jgi:hypothetical protein
MNRFIKYFFWVTGFIWLFPLLGYVLAYCGGVLAPIGAIVLVIFFYPIWIFNSSGSLSNGLIVGPFNAIGWLYVVGFYEGISSLVAYFISRSSWFKLGRVDFDKL